MVGARYRATMNFVTDDVRSELRAELARRRIKQSDLAAELGMSRTYLSNVLNGQRGQLSEKLQSLLDYLDLELTLRPKTPRIRDSSGRVE